MTAEEYKASLPKTKTQGFTKWTMETFSTYVHLLYPHVTVAPGQEWTGTRTEYKFICEKHGEYFALASLILGYKRGNQCKDCQNENHRLRQYQITLSKIGQTTPDGHLILEHVGYHATPYDIKKGKSGVALYRYKCAQCGNDQATARVNNLFTGGHTTHCGCQKSNRESIAQHRRCKDKAMQPCNFYVADFYFSDYLKLGISNNYDRRAAQGNRNNPYFDKDLTPEEHTKANNIDLSYEHCWYLSPPFPRAWVFSVEQILLKATAHYAPTKPLPKEVIETIWSGQTELRDWKLDPRAVQAAFIKLIAEIQRSDGDWYAVYCKHINNYKIK